MVKPETRSFYARAVDGALRRIVGQLDEPLDLPSLARAAALSPFHFHRIFRGMIGETPLELHRRLRLERAAWRLRHAEAPVTAIAFGAGYETHEAFTRAFRAAFGAAPSAFREAARAATRDCTRPPQIELAARSGLHYHPEVDPFDLPTLDPTAPAMQIDITDMPAQRVATVRHVGPYHTISEAFARLGRIVGPAGFVALPCAAMVGIYHDDPDSTPIDELRSDAGLVVPDDVALPEGLDELRIAAGPYARYVHVGPYTNLGDAWGRLMGEWLPASGHRVGDGVTFEIYRNTPMDAPPEELRTELYLPLAP